MKPLTANRGLPFVVRLLNLDLNLSNDPIQRGCPVIQEGKLLISGFPPKTLYCLHSSFDLLICTGKVGFDVLWVMPYSLQNLANSLEANCGPPSLRITSGMPCRLNCAFSTSMAALLPRSSSLSTSINFE